MALLLSLSVSYKYGIDRISGNDNNESFGVNPTQEIRAVVRDARESGFCVRLRCFCRSSSAVRMEGIS